MAAKATKATSELALFDRLSRLTFLQATKLLGPDGKRFLHAGGAWEIDLDEQVELSSDAFRLRLDGTVVTISLSPAARDRIDWSCDACDLPCEHAGAAFSLILEEKLALGLTVTLPGEAALDTLARSLASLLAR